MNTELIHWGWLASILSLMLACLTTGISAWFYYKGVDRGRHEGYRFAKQPWDKELDNVAESLGDVIQGGDYRQHRIGCDLSIHPAHRPIPENWLAEIGKCRKVDCHDIPRDSHYYVARRKWTLLARKFVDEIHRLEEREAEYLSQIAELEDRADG